MVNNCKKRKNITDTFLLEEELVSEKNYNR